MKISFFSVNFFTNERDQNYNLSKYYQTDNTTKNNKKKKQKQKASKQTIQTTLKKIHLNTTMRESHQVKKINAEFFRKFNAKVI